MSELPQIDRQLANMKDWQLITFCAALTERMLPNFTLFSGLVEFGNADQLRQILNGVWDHLSNSGAKMNFEVQMDRVEDNIPDLDEYTMYGALPAHDASVALFETLNCIIAADKAEASAIANLSREAVATFIEVTEGEDDMSDVEMLRLINTHELMEIEEDFQQKVIDLVTAMKQPKRDGLQEIRELAANNGISNIGISDTE